MTTPAGYAVQIPGRGRMLFLDQYVAVDKAVPLHGVVTPLYSIPQIIEALEERSEYESDAGAAIEQINALGFGVLA